MRKTNGQLSDNTSWEFNDVPGGGGGYSSFFGFNSQGDMALGTDTTGMYVRRKNDKKWTFLFTLDNTGEEVWGQGNPYNTIQNCNFISWAPSNPNRLYAAICGYMYRVDFDPDKAFDTPGYATLTRFTMSPMMFDAGSGLSRLQTDGVSVHPTDDQTMIFATSNQGVWYTTNGGASITQITGLASQFGYVGDVLFSYVGEEGRERFTVAIDQSNPDYVYIGVQGRGIYRSTSGVAGTFSLIAGSPKSCSSMCVTAAGDLWITADHRVDLLTNPKLLTTTDWTAGNGATLSIDSPGSMRVVNVGGQAGYAYQAITLEPGHYQSAVRGFSGETGQVGHTLKIGTAPGLSDIAVASGGEPDIETVVQVPFTLASETTVYISLTVATSVTGNFCRFAHPLIGPAGVYKIARGGSSFTSYGNPYSYPNIQMRKIRVDPFNSNNIRTFQEQGGAYSSNGGTSWSDWAPIVGPSTEVPSQSRNYEYTGKFSDFSYDPSTQNRMGFAEGFGSYLTDNANVKDCTVRSISAGTEQKIDVCFSVNPDGFAMLWGMDKPVMPVQTLTTYTNRPSFGAHDRLDNGGMIDWAIDDPDFWAQSVQFHGNWCAAWTPNGRASTPVWNKFLGLPTVENSTGSTGLGDDGAIAVSTKNNIVLCPSGGAYSSYTKDGGASWAPIYLDGTLDYRTNWGTNIRKRNVVAADKETPGRFAMVVGWNSFEANNVTYGPTERAGLWVSNDEGDTWAQHQQGVVGFNGASGQSVQNAGWNPIQAYDCHLMYVPGFAGELLYTSYDFLGGHYPLFWSQDNGLNFEQVSTSVRNVFGYGFGKALEGQARPAVAFRGEVLIGGQWKWGVYITLDWFQTFIRMTPTNPRGYFGQVGGIAGDPTTFGRFYMPVEGKGSTWSAVRDVATAS